ncbi:MAG: hypothetical protein R3211_07095, partial [Balneolaceae bacterium]|nr:hypothetical protein [Balneolaceae bacterium]
PSQDIYFVSNFTGDPMVRDSAGFISKVTPDGEIDMMKFMTGTNEHPLHSPRGMFITGDTLWAADLDGVHGFNRTSGEQVAFVDFTDFNPGFLNDIAAGPEGALYVTDTGTSKLYKISGSGVTVAADSLPHPPNGVTLSADGNRLILAPWGGGTEFHAWNPGEGNLEKAATLDEGGNFDGIEIVDGRWVITSQADSSLHVFSDGKSWQFIHTTGAPADLGIDTKRNRVAVPYVDRNEVDIWPLPKESEEEASGY